MIIKMMINKVGEAYSYIDLPVTDRLALKSFGDKSRVIGIVREVVEIDDKYELTIQVWDRFVTQEIERITDKPIAISLDFV